MGSKYDVIVVGAGLAGLAAALSCAECNLSVAIFEFGTAERYLCNSRITGGIFHIAIQDITSEPNGLLLAIDKVTAGSANLALVKALADDGLRAVRWLQQHGARFIKGAAQPWQSAMLAPPGLVRTGLHWRGRSGDVLLQTLERRLHACGGKILRGVRARSLVVDSGRCTGIVADVAGCSQHFESAAVVICDGGFQNSPELVKQYISSKPHLLCQRNAGTGMGDGVQMVMERGGVFVGMNKFYGHVQSRGAVNSERLWPYPILDHVATSGIVVDDKGNRFTDEGLGGIAIANAIAALNDPMSSMVIFDAKIWDGPGKHFIHPPNPNLPLCGGRLIQAASIGELAQGAKIPIFALEQSIGNYNRAISERKVNSLRPSRSESYFSPMPIMTPPFFAAPASAGITYTMGGIATNEHGQVLISDSRTIGGLYAAGCCTGGLEGGPLAGYTGGLSKAAVFGLRAADHILSMLNK
jgi:fumarate reductase flavoprotein subunit